MISGLLKIGLLASITFGQDLSGYDSGYEISAAGSFYGYEVDPDDAALASYAAEPGEEGSAYDDYAYEALDEAFDEAGHNPIESIAENLPVFIVALVAVIIGQQIFIPLIAPLLNPATLATSLGPVGNIMVGILNIFLAPLGLAICTIAPVLAIVNPIGRSFSSNERNSPEGFTFNAEPAIVENIASTLYKALLGEYISCWHRDILTFYLRGVSNA